MSALFRGVKDRLPPFDRAKLSPLLCIGILIALNLAFYTKAAPTLRLVELAVCREHYLAADPSLVGRDGYVPEELCKLEHIQSKVAWLFTLDELLHFCCDFIATIPAGLVTDRYGPRPALLLNVGGFIASWAWVVATCVFYHTFNVNMVLIGPLFNLFGGASHVLLALTYSEAARHVQDRTTMFSVLEAIDPAAQFVGPVLGSSLLLIDVYTPFYVVFPVALTALPLIMLLPPKTPPEEAVKQDEASEHEALLTPASRRESDPARCDADASGSSPFSLRAFGGKLSTRVRTFASMFRKMRLVQWAAAALFVVTFGKQSLHILMQYVSKRFGVPVAEAGYLLSVKAGVNLLLYLVVLPLARRSQRSSAASVNGILLRLSIVLLALGTALMGLSPSLGLMVPSLVVYAAGFGFPVLVRSIVTGAVTAEPNWSIPLLFSGLAIAETAGSFAGAAALTATFTATIGQSGAGAGVPFFVCSGSGKPAKHTTLTKQS